jgi:hypothetical protein
MKTLAVVRAIVFVLLAAYTLYATPWGFLTLDAFKAEGLSARTPQVLEAMKPIVLAAWLAVAWIGVDAYLSFALGRKAREAARKPGSAAGTPA